MQSDAITDVDDCCRSRLRTASDMLVPAIDWVMLVLFSIGYWGERNFFMLTYFLPVNLCGLFNLPWSCWSPVRGILRLVFVIVFAVPNILSCTYRVMCLMSLKTSLYTTFLALSAGIVSLSAFKIFSPFLFVTLERATYTWPCVNTCFGRHRPNDWPWLLFSHGNASW